MHFASAIIGKHQSSLTASPFFRQLLQQALIATELINDSPRFKYSFMQFLKCLTKIWLSISDKTYMPLFKIVNGQLQWSAKAVSNCGWTKAPCPRKADYLQLKQGSILPDNAGHFAPQKITNLTEYLRISPRISLQKYFVHWCSRKENLLPLYI